MRILLGFSALFPGTNKVRLPQASRVRACPPVSAYGLGRLMRQRRRRSARRDARRRFALLPKHWTVPTRGGRKSRGGRGNFPSLLPHAPLVAALVVDNGSGMLQAGFLVSTRQWHVQGWSLWCCSSRCVPVVGIGSGMRWLVLLVTIHVVLCFRLLSIPVAIPQVQFLVKVICPLLSCLMLLVRQRRKLWLFRSCISSTVIDIPFRSAEADPHGPDYSADHRDSPVGVLLQMVDVPVVRACRVSGAAVEKAFVLPQLQLVEKLPPVVQTASNCRNSAVAVLSGRRHFLHGAEADSHGPVGPQSFPQWRVDTVVDVPVYRSCRFFVAVCVKTVETPQCCSSSSLSWRRYRFPWSVFP